MIAKSKYQIFPDLVPLEYEALRTSIPQCGVDIPIIWDHYKNVIDGWHPEQACGEPLIDGPRCGSSILRPRSWNWS